MVWLPDGEKISKTVLIRFDRMYERNGHTDRHTLHDGIGRASIARQKLIKVDRLESGLRTPRHGSVRVRSMG